MTESTRIHLKLTAVGLLAVGVWVVLIHVAPVWIAMLVGFACWLVAGYAIVTAWGYGKLGRRLAQMDAADAAVAREAFFTRYPWLRRQSQQANSTLHPDARSSSAADQPPSARAGGRGR
jgi:thiol:disulfide interchange protein